MGINNLITNKTKIIELTKTNLSHHALSKKIGIRKDVYECWNDWYCYDDKWYYFKSFTSDKYTSYEFKFLNELIGEYLANYLNIDVIHYEIAKAYNTLGLASQSFIKQGNKYYFAQDINIRRNSINMDNISFLFRKCYNNQNYLELVTEIYKFIAIDIYMNQTDRSYANYQFRKEHGHLHLAPLYDFEESFLEPYQDKYYSHLLGINIDDINRYEELRHYLISLLDLDIRIILKRVAKEKNIIIPDHYINYYNEFVIDRKRLLISVLNKTKTL